MNQNKMFKQIKSLILAFKLVMSKKRKKKNHRFSTL